MTFSHPLSRCFFLESLPLSQPIPASSTYSTVPGLLTAFKELTLLQYLSMTSRQRFLNTKLYKMRFLSLIGCVITLTFLSLVSTPTKASALKEPLPKPCFNYHPSELLARVRTIIPTFHSSSRGTANPQRHVSGLWDIFSNVYSVQAFPSSYWRALCPNPERKATTDTVLSKTAYNLMGSIKSPEIELDDGKRALHRGFLEKLGVYCWRLGNCGLLSRKESSNPITGPTDKKMDSDIPHEVNINTEVPGGCHVC